MPDRSEDRSFFSSETASEIDYKAVLGAAILAEEGSFGFESLKNHIPSTGFSRR
jgi:hypothetical protein